MKGLAGRFDIAVQFKGGAMARWQDCDMGQEDESGMYNLYRDGEVIGGFRTSEVLFWEFFEYVE